MIDSINFSDVISCAALVVSILALRRTKDIKAQYEANITMTELNRRELNRQDLEKSANIYLEYDSDDNKLILTNTGKSDAIDVVAELVDNPEMVDLEDRFPLTVKADSITKVPMRAWIGRPDFVNIKVSWSDEEGNSHSNIEKMYL